jgi:hypothetical protein
MFDVSRAQGKLKFLFAITRKRRKKFPFLATTTMADRVSFRYLAETQNGEMGGMRLIINPTARI